VIPWSSRWVLIVYRRRMAISRSACRVGSRMPPALPPHHGNRHGPCAVDPHGQLAGQDGTCDREARRARVRRRQPDSRITAGGLPDQRWAGAPHSRRRCQTSTVTLSAVARRL
jgi:hypothetical protein